MRTPKPYCTLIAVTLLLTACQVGPRSFENENDRLRAEVLRLNRDNERMHRDIAALETALEAAELRASADVPPLPAGVRRPVVVQLVVGRLSGLLDTDQDGKPDAARIYLRTLDSHSRFVQAIGELELTVVDTPAGESATTLATASFDAPTFDAAYRSGITGTHYTITCDLAKLPAAGSSQVTVSLALRDLLHGHVLTTNAVVGR